MQESGISRTQYGIYLECISNPDATTYNLPHLIRVAAGYSAKQVEEAIYSLVEAHEALSARVHTDDKGQVYVKTGYPTQIGISKISENEFAIARRNLVEPFSMKDENLSRFHLYITDSNLYLFMDVHHLIADGTSIAILLSDLSKALCGEKLEKEACTLHDINLEEEHLRTTQEFEASKAFYTGLLDGFDTDCAIIADVHGDKKGQGWLTYEFDLDESALSELKKDNGISKSAFFASALGLLVSRYNYTRQSVISTIYSGRTDAQYNHTVSMMVKTMPFVTDLDKTSDVKELLGLAQENLKKSRENTIYSFVDIASDLGVTNDINFAYQGTLNDFDSYLPEGFHVERICDDTHIEETKLLLELLDHGNGKYELRLGYRKDCYSDALANGIAKAYEKACAGLLCKKNISDIQLLDEDNVRILDGFNETDKEYVYEPTIVETIRNIANQYPDHTAVVYKDVQISYSKLDHVTDALAKVLIDEGIRKEVAVVILIPRCEYMPIASLAVSKAGGAYLPLDPSYPPERLNLMVKDSGAKVLITTPELTGIIDSSFTGRRIMIQDIPSLCENMIAQNGYEALREAVLASAPDKEDLFILLYTSGSTGVPKGVMLKHSNIAAFCAWARDYQGLSDNSRVAAYASFGFDANMADTYPALTSGACLYILEEDIRLDLIRIHEYFGEHQITHGFMTTQIARQFAGIGELPYLQYMGTGGEKLAPMDPPSYRFCNLYGPTECTVLMTSFELDQYYKDIPIGKPIHNARVYVVDSDCNRLPIGAAGELWLSGPQVSRGYLNRPEKTAESFITNPFCDDEKYQAVYRTGDVVRILPDGNIQFIGRRDAQVKIRGFRIELTEVEEIIRRFPPVKDATTQAFDDPAGGKYVAAYVVSKDGSEIDIDALNRFILEEKPPYMVPAVTMQIDAIPYNQNQKVNKKALPMPERKKENFVSPENETQQKIYELLSGLLGHTDFGVDTDIYEAGLTSIGAVSFNVMLSKAFDVPVRTQDIKDNSTIRSLALFVGSADKAEKFEVQKEYPLTKTQQGIYVECLANPGSTLYNIPMLFELDDQLEESKLINAIVEAINAHPYILTTLASNQEGDICQIRDAGAVFQSSNIGFIRCGSIDEAKESLVQPYELMGKRLFRISVIQTDLRKYLFVDMHHIISDGTSLNILLSDISRAYAGEELEKEAFSGYECALLERRSREGSALERAKSHYKGMLSEADTSCAPPKTVSGEPESSDILVYDSGINAAELMEFCEKKNISMSTLMNAAFGYVLGKYVYKEDVLYCTVYNGRNDSRMERMMSMLVKTFPVRVAWDQDTKVEECLSKLGDQMLSSMTFDLYSFAEIAHDYQVSADILFTYQGDLFAMDSLCGLPCKSVTLSLDQAKADMDIDCVIKEGRIQLNCSYRSDLYDRQFMQALSESICIAAVMMTRCDKMSEVTIASDAMKKQILKVCGEACPIADESVNLMFERMAKANPQRDAVIAAGETLSYQELNILANRAAHALHERGVRGDEVVGLISDRSKAAFIGEMAILKSGGAFLPMVPEYPDDRIDFCLRDAGSRFVLTTQAIYQEKKALFENKPYEALLIEELTAKKDPAWDENLDLLISGDSLAYCIYTSGSTGTPKGVMIEHRNLRNFLDPNEKNPETRHYVERGSVILSVISISFDFSLMETQLPLCNGLTVCMAAEEEIHDPIQLAKLMQKYHVDVMACTPSMIGNMIDIPQIADALSNMKLYDFGAEAFPSSLYDKLRKASPDALICNGYGPTETTISCVSKVLDSGDAITIGKPAANVRTYVCDKQMNLLPIGACGELVIGGYGVGRGYVNLPEKTAEVFVQREGERVYRTGDLVRYLFNGEIEFFGRLDNQVKLRGFRVELDEIENTIISFPGIKNCKVVVRNNGSEDYLAGFFTADSEISLDELTAMLKEKLTYYMVPAALMQLDDMPLTVNGKIDKKKLPEVSYTATREYAAPANELEGTICDLFARVLHQDQVGATENFFEIGGTSLTVTNVVIQLTDAGYSVVYKNLFEYPTPRELASFINGDGSGENPAKESAADKLKLKQEVFSAYDYAAIRKMLEKETIEHVDEIKEAPLGNIILTGATGFLGIHILKDFLDRYTGIAYLLIRKGKYESCEKRMQYMLMYYFGKPMEELFGDRIVCIEGDITDTEQVKQLIGVPADTVINCAACVKHFVKDDILDRVNTQGVMNLVDMCISAGKRLIQISTTSVGGALPAEQAGRVIRENDLYFGQVIDNDYIRTKFLAERAVLEARASRGLRGQIIRVGNLMSRASDGEFQINLVTNGFMRSLKAYKQLKAFPISGMYSLAEFSPIDSTAQAILTLAASENDFGVFHAYNSHMIYMSDVIYAMKRYGFEIDIVSDEKFAQIIKEASKNEKLSGAILGLIAYASGEKEALCLLDADNRFTVELLYRLNYLWPITDNQYLENCIRILDGFEFFDIDE